MSITVPDLFEQTAVEAENVLKHNGLHWKLAGDLRQHAIVRTQTPVAGTMVKAGSVVELLLRIPGLPGPNIIDDDDLGNSETVHVTHEPE